MKDEDEPEVVESAPVVDSKASEPRRRFGLSCLVIILIAILIAIAGSVYVMSCTMDCGGGAELVKTGRHRR